MKTRVRTLLNRFGFDIVRFSRTGRNPLADVRLFLQRDDPLIFDVGANVGQSVAEFKEAFPNSTIHSFEPSPHTFETLRARAARYSAVHLHNFALGSTTTRMTFKENDRSTMSSFLPMGQYGWGTIARETTVDVNTVDEFCRRHGIGHIDLLKSDTQGFDFEVFKGAEHAFRSNMISLIYFEVIFSDMYEGLPAFGDVYNFLVDRSFRLVSFYESHYQDDLASWTDALFVHTSRLPAR